MNNTVTRYLLGFAGLVAAVAGTGLQAQAAAPQQYVVVYGELAPNLRAEQDGASVLEALTFLAKADGAQTFVVSEEIERPNFFSVVEVWPNAASYASFTGSAKTQRLLNELQPFLIAPLDERDGNFVK